MGAHAVTFDDYDRFAAATGAALQKTRDGAAPTAR